MTSNILAVSTSVFFTSVLFMSCAQKSFSKSKNSNTLEPVTLGEVREAECRKMLEEEKDKDLAVYRQMRQCDRFNRKMEREGLPACAANFCLEEIISKSGEPVQVDFSILSNIDLNAVYFEVKVALAKRREKATFARCISASEKVRKMSFSLEELEALRESMDRAEKFELCKVLVGES